MNKNHFWKLKCTILFILTSHIVVITSSCKFHCFILKKLGGDIVIYLGDYSSDKAPLEHFHLSLPFHLWQAQNSRLQLFLNHHLKLKYSINLPKTTKNNDKKFSLAISVYFHHLLPAAMHKASLNPQLSLVKVVIVEKQNS